MTARIISIVAFLSLLGFIQAADPNCENITKPLELVDDYSSILGKWIFTQGITNYDSYGKYLKSINSSWVELTPSSQKDTLVRNHGININGKCQFETLNSTVQNNTIFTTGIDMKFIGNFLSSCSDCLTTSFTIQSKNETFKSLYLYSRSSKVSESEKDLYWKQAACLGFKKEPQFTFDGVTELCKEEKMSSPTEQTKPEDKKEDRK